MVAATFVADWITDVQCDLANYMTNDTAKIILREYEAYDKNGLRSSVYDTIIVHNLPPLVAGGTAENVYCAEKDTTYCGVGFAGPYFILPELCPDDDPYDCDTVFLMQYNAAADKWEARDIDGKCGLALHLDEQLFGSDGCETTKKYVLEVKQSCYGPETGATCGTGGLADNAFEYIPAGGPNLGEPLYMRCEFWLTDQDTVAPTAICKGAPFFEGPLAQENWTFNTIRDFDFLNEDFLGGLVGDIPAFDDIMIPDFLTMLDTSKAPYSLTYGSEQIIADPDLYLGLNLGFMEAESDMDFSFNWDFLLGAFDEETAIVPEAGAIGLVGYGINGTFYKLVEGVEEPLLDEFEPYQEYLDGIMEELEVDGELCNLNVSLLLEDAWGNTKISLEEGDVFTLFGVWVASSDASIQFSGENLVSTTSHDCAAHAYVPPLIVHDDWSGIKQVKASVEGIGTVLMSYDAVEGCWVSKEQLEFGHREEPYLITYEIYDSCHNVGTELCYLQVKDRTKPIAVADKGVTVSLGEKKVWVEASTFDEGSWDNCEVNFLLARRSDWSTACVDLCVNVVDTASGTYEPAVLPVWTDGHDTLWCLDLEDDKTYDAVEAHYAKQLDWWCKDGEACSELIYNSWTYDLVKAATIQCAPHSYLDDQGFENLLKKALQNPNADTSGVLNGLLEEKFKCAENLANAECILPFSFGRFPLLELLIGGDFEDLGDEFDFGDNLEIPILAPGSAKVEMGYIPAERALCGYNDATLDHKLSSWRSIGGGWSDAVPFSCEDACGPVTVEILVMDYWCNWSTSWTDVWVEDLTPVEVAKDVVDGTITCKAYKDTKYSYGSEEHPVSIERIVAGALEGEQDAYDALDGIFGGYEKAWKDPYGKYVDIEGVELDCELPLYDSTCACTTSYKEVRIYDEHLGYLWVDSLVQDCYYEADTVDFQHGVVVVNCADNVYCEQEVWVDLDHCGQGYIHRKFKIWQRCADSTYVDHPRSDSIHPVDTVYRHQKIYVGNECDLDKAMFELPQDTAVETCAIEYDGAGNVTGIAGPENTGTPSYTFDDDCRIVGIAHEDKVYKIVGGDAACYKILRTWYFADWCGTEGPATGKWWHDAGLVVDKYVQKIIVTDTVAPVCLITGPVEDGGSVQLSACTYTLAVEVDAQDACGLTSYYWELTDISKTDDQMVVDQGDGVLTGAEEESFGIVSEDLISGVYFLRVRIQDECNNESFCDYTVEVLPGKKPSPVCITSLTARLTPWDSDGDGIIDSAHAIVWAEEYNESSQLACSDDSLEFRIEFIGDSPANEVPEAGSTSLEVTCADIGTQMVRMWVISHPSMTADFCDAFLVVQSNGSGCNTKQGTGERVAQTEGQTQMEINRSIAVGSAGFGDIEVTGDIGQFSTDGFILEQNTPNPFRHETSVKFTLPESMEANLTVFDLTGRELKSVNATFNKGRNEVLLSRTELQSSGVLYYRLSAGEFMEVRRMILID